MSRFFKLAIFLFASSCTNDYELQRSIYLVDPNHPGLPEYTEWGYNTFGAYYERGVFIYNSVDYPIKVITENDSTSFNFQGIMLQFLIRVIIHITIGQSKYP